MNFIKTVGKIANANEHEQQYFIHETKYALLGAALMVIFALSWSDGLIKSVFPFAKGPIVMGYKVVLFIAIYYIIQKTDWFQEL